MISLLVLLFFVSTSGGFADISSVQEQLREIQLKLVRERAKLIQQEILNVSKQLAKTPPVSEAAPVAMSREALAKDIEMQIAALENTVVSLRPRAVEEEAARIENRMREISAAIPKARGVDLLGLRAELQKLADEYEILQRTVQERLEESLRAQQVLLLRQQFLILKEKVETLPRAAPPSVPAVSAGAVAPSGGFKTLDEQVQQLQLKVLQTQTKLLKEKLKQVLQK